MQAEDRAPARSQAVRVPPPAAADRAPQQPAAAPAAAPAETGSLPAAADTRPPLVFPSDPAAAPKAAPPTAPPVSPPAARQSDGWIGWLAAALAALLGLLALVMLRQRREAYAGGGAERVAPRPDPPAPPPAAAPPPPPPEHPPRPRPRIELGFVPARAAATDDQVEVDYELAIVNSGQLAAEKIQLEIRMLNAGPGHDAELEAFFEGREAAPSAPAPRPLPAGQRIALSSKAVMPRAEAREIVVENRRLFVPVVAFNLSYEWRGGGAGRTSAAFVVGRESDPPSEKMGPFRLDLGPRVWRNVGQRPHAAARRI